MQLGLGNVFSFSYQVIQSIMQSPFGAFYNPENIFVASNGTGAGNNWAAGYSQAQVIQEEIMEIVDREVDGSDSLEVTTIAIYEFSVAL